MVTAFYFIACGCLFFLGFVILAAVLAEFRGVIFGDRDSESSEGSGR